MHVLHIVENNSVPTDIRVWREATTARGAGHAVTVICPQSNRYPAAHEVIDGVEIFRHPMIRTTGTTLNQVAEYIVACCWQTWLCVRVFFSKRFDVIHAANPPDHVFALAWPFRFFGVKFVFDHHDLAPELFLAKFGTRKGLVYCILSAMERMSCTAADAVISTNLSYKMHVIDRWGIAPEKVFVVRNDPERAAAGSVTIARPLAAPTPVSLVYVGSINPQDGVDLLVRSLHILFSERQERRFVCTVIGDGSDLPRVKALCTELGMEGHVRFTGYVHDRSEVQKTIRNADICLETAPHSDANTKSTFIKVMEYMAAAKPIVAFDLTETRFSTQGSAVLVPQGDLHAFANAVLGLMKDPVLRDELGRCARDRIERTLNWENASIELLRAYEYARRPRAVRSSQSARPVGSPTPSERDPL